MQTHSSFLSNCAGICGFFYALISLLLLLSALSGPGDNGECDGGALALAAFPALAAGLIGGALVYIGLWEKSKKATAISLLVALPVVLALWIGWSYLLVAAGC